MKFFCTSLLLVLSMPLTAQKIDIDRFPISVQYIKPPETNALVTRTTYMVRFYSDPTYVEKVGLHDDDLEHALTLNGYKYVKDKGEILLELKINKWKVVSEKIEPNVVHEKNASGHYVNKTYYRVMSGMAAHTEMKLVDQVKDMVMENFGFATEKYPIVYYSPNFVTQQQAQEFLQKNLAAKRDEYFRTKYKESFHKAFEVINKKYAFTPVCEQEELLGVSVKKAPKFTASFNKELAKARKAFDKMTCCGGVESIKKELAPTMKYWSQTASKMKVQDSKTRKLKYAYLINLARTQYWLDMFDECAATSKKIIENKYEETEGKLLIEYVKSSKKLLEASNQPCRHIYREAFNSADKFRVSGNIRKISS